MISFLNDVTIVVLYYFVFLLSSFLVGHDWGENGRISFNVKDKTTIKMESGKRERVRASERESRLRIDRACNCGSGAVFGTRGGEFLRCSKKIKTGNTRRFAAYYYNVLYVLSSANFRFTDAPCDTMKIIFTRRHFAFLYKHCNDDEIEMIILS